MARWVPSPVPVSFRRPAPAMRRWGTSATHCDAEVQSPRGYRAPRLDTHHGHTVPVRCCGTLRRAAALAGTCGAIPRLIQSIWGRPHKCTERSTRGYASCVVPSMLESKGGCHAPRSMVGDGLGCSNPMTGIPSPIVVQRYNECFHSWCQMELRPVHGQFGIQALTSGRKSEDTRAGRLALMRLATDEPLVKRHAFGLSPFYLFSNRRG